MNPLYQAQKNSDSIIINMNDFHNDRIQSNIVNDDDEAKVLDEIIISIDKYYPPHNNQNVKSVSQLDKNNKSSGVTYMSSVKEEKCCDAATSDNMMNDNDDEDNNGGNHSIEDDETKDPMTTTATSRKVPKRIKPRSNQLTSIESHDGGVSVDGAASKSSSIIDDFLEYFDLHDKCTANECMCFTFIFIFVAVLLGVGAVVMVLSSQ
jgi:hypothetical protein